MKKVSQYDKCDFIQYLVVAIDKAEQAISSITYSSYPEINKDTINKIQSAIDILDDVMNLNIYQP